MEYTENKSILSFDMLYTSNHIQILKILLPCFECQMQKKLAVMIKYLELQYTIEYFRKHPQSPASTTGLQGGDIVEIFDQIRSFCTPSERVVFDQLTTLKQNMERYDEMMNMMQMFSGLGGMDSGNSEESFNPMELLKNMLTPEQQSMFEMFTTAFPATENQF